MRGLVVVHADLRDILETDGLKKRFPRNNYNNILTTILKIAAKELKINPNIFIRRADNDNVYVILDKLITIKINKTSSIV